MASPVKTPQINDRGHLLFGGCDVVDLAEEFGTPLMLLDEGFVRTRCREYRAAFARVWPNSRVLYAGKAFLSTAMCRIIDSEGLSLDVVSGGELATAMAAGFPPDRLWFHGNNKSEAELRMGLTHRIARFVLDSGDEIDRLSALAAQREDAVKCQIRVTPGIKPSTHAYIQTGQVDSKFGFSVGNGQALAAVQNVLARSSLRLTGIHCHIGSQIHEIASFAAEVAALIDFLAQVKAATAWVPEELNLGGGLGIAYLPQDEPASVDAYVELLAGALTRHWSRLEAPPPIVMIEPGRSIVGEAGLTVYRVGTIKEIPGVRTYVSVDGGMTDNLRVALYQARYHAVLANRMHEPCGHKFSIAGKCCETGDMLAWDVALPDVQKNDLLAVFSTGAYHYALANNYNRLPRPAVVGVMEGRARPFVRRETYEDVLSHDVIPDDMRADEFQSKE